MFKQLILGSVVASSLFMAGCASKGTANGSLGSDSSSGLSSSTAGQDAYGSANQLGNSGGDDTSGLTLAQRTVYFEFDSTDINSDGQAIVSRFAKYLAGKPSAKLRLEGHADERGTREYNVGLGERRANAVQQALVAGGASASQISVVSYGEERPADPGHDESAWGKNRRVEIVQL
jgi:peptidoglycan-associated lipoprotein